MSAARPDTTLLPLDVPFLPNEEYLDFLSAHTDRIHSMYVPLHLPQVPDARPADVFLEPRRLAQLLARCPVPRKNALVNSRFHLPEAYSDKGFMDALAGALRILLDAGQISGLVYSDHYLLQALSDAHPDLCPHLSALPSVNCLLDTLPKILWHLEYIATTRFRPPNKINLDRGLNRRLPALERLSVELRQHQPNLAITLLANEGCLPYCPYRGAHESHLALAHQHGLGAAQMSANRTRGCTRLFADKPELLLASPFIRPEDQSGYSRVADVLKICGRSRGPKAMRAIMEAYLAGRYRGNLLWLNDTQECLANVFYIANHELPQDFLLRVGNCDFDCSSCGQCRFLVSAHLERLSPQLRPMTTENT